VKPALLRRGQYCDPPWPAIGEPLAFIAPTRPRVKPALMRRGHYFDPGWGQQAQAGGVGLLTRPIMGVGL
jgi:hypothetical protein